MKKILLILILILSFQSWTNADDVRDFEIEGMSIGDSLLNYFSVEEMKSLSRAEYKSKKYARIILTSSNLDIYDDIDFYFRTNDKKYSMKAVVGGLYYEDLDECFNKKDQIVDEIKALFNNTKIEEKEMIHQADLSGKSVEYKVEFEFNSGSLVKVSCMDWSDEITKKHNWADHLKVGVYDIQFIKWLMYEAFE